MGIFKNLSIVILLVAIIVPSYTRAVVDESYSRWIWDSVRSASESRANPTKVSSIDQILQKTDVLIRSRWPSSVDLVLTNLDRLISTTGSTAKKAALTTLKQKIVAQKDTVILSKMGCFMPPYDYNVVRVTADEGWWETTFFKDPRLPVKNMSTIGNGDMDAFKKKHDNILKQLVTLYEKSKPDTLYQWFPFKKTFPIQVGSGVFFGVNVNGQTFKEEDRIKKIELQILKDSYSHGPINSDETIVAKFDNIIPHIRIIGDVDSENIAYHRYYASEGGTAKILRVEVLLTVYGISLTEVYSNGNWIEFSSLYSTWSVSKDGKVTQIPSSADNPFAAIKNRREFVTERIKTMDWLISNKGFGVGDWAYPSWHDIKQLEFFHPESFDPTLGSSSCGAK